MYSRARTWALIATTYVVMLQTVHILWTGRAIFSLETGLKALVVPAVQVLALLVSRRVTGAHTFPAGGSLTQFFGNWLVLAVALHLTSTSVEFFASRRVDLTTRAFFLLLAVPTVQSAVLALPLGQTRRLFADTRVAIANSLARPVLCIDAMMLSVGWFFSDHPLVGIAVAAILQRRWTGTKLFLAAACCALVLLRDGERRRWTRPRAALLAFAIALGILGIDAFLPWSDAIVSRRPALFPSHPIQLLRLEIYVAGLVIVLLLALEARAALTRRSILAGSLLAAGTVPLFLATLAVVMNGFLSIQPVYPWAGVAMTMGSAAATLFLVGALTAMSSAPTPDAERI